MYEVENVVKQQCMSDVIIQFFSVYDWLEKSKYSLKLSKYIATIVIII